MNTVSIIKQAILNQNPLIFLYRGKIRYVEPHHYGLLNNTMQIHAYQFAGESNSGPIPQWRNFKVHLMKNTRVDRMHHFYPETTYNPQNSHYSSIETFTLLKKRPPGLEDLRLK